MEIQQLRHLIAAIETGNLLKAADKSCISQSGLSRSIKSLETRLGVPLLVRGPKGVEATVYGLSVMRRAQVILNEVAKSVGEVHAIEQGRTGEVVIGITQNYAHYLVPALLAEIHRERPALRFTVVADGFVELLELVRGEKLDFAFGLIGEIRRNDGIVIEPLSAHRSRVFCGRNHPLADGGTATLDELHAAQWTMLASEGVQRGFSTFFESRGLSVPAQTLKTNSIALIHRMLEESNVLTVVPVEIVKKSMEDGRIVALECETPVAQTRIGLFFREGGLPTPQAELVIERFRRLLKPAE
jgi:DNA-binding transcriptional LysR family regulator